MKMCQYGIGIPVLSKELCISIDIKNILSVSIKSDFWRRSRGCGGDGGGGWVDVEVGTESVR